MKIILTGGRNYENRELVSYYLEGFDPSAVIVGDCPSGLDNFVYDYYRDGLFVDPKLQRYKANWTKYGASAGPKRNRLMCKEHKDANFLIAFPGGKGTEDCIRHAKEFGIPVLRVDD